ncbi:VOC family protein [Flexibacterium corallicola]|uniref:VOC family protein n=1 Tax=Flexibacterium corallicola TaxID=3037259 RepID=UPI00286EE67A|nr:VOC family protein [Pseudovibrio sp. M1P-2-3]
MKQANPINIRHIDHVVLRVANLNTMSEFYCNVLGCRLERGPGTLGLVQLRAGNALIDLADINGPLGQKGGGAPDHSAPTVDHFCLRISPWCEEDIIAHLKHHNVKMGSVEERYGASGRGPSLYIEDVEGNKVELKG